MGVPKTIKVFADGAKIEDFKKLNALPYISGFTTNPSLMKKAGVKNYLEFVETALKKINLKPTWFSFEHTGVKTIFNQ